MAFKRFLFRAARLRRIHQAEGIFPAIVVGRQANGLLGHLSHAGKRSTKPVEGRVVANRNRKRAQQRGKSALHGCMAGMELPGKRVGSGGMLH